MRHLVSIRTVNEVNPIPDSDYIESVKVGGWNVVTKKGVFKPYDQCVYFEIDSLIPLSPRFDFIKNRKTVHGVEYAYIKTMKIRGVYSQGLALSLDLFSSEELKDLTKLKVEKWEPPVPISSGEIIGQWPSWLPKTDEERIQNISPDDLNMDWSWFATEKVDGSSVTIAYDGDIKVCSRNWQVNHKSTAWQVAYKLGFFDILESHYRGTPIAMQGELIGPNIQGNPLRVKKPIIKLFTYFDSGKVAYKNWPYDIKSFSVPRLALRFTNNIDSLITQVDGFRSAINSSKNAEGIVWRAEDDYVLYSFKVINNKYLLKEQ